ncbi:MAG: SbcC/MukB-like Walker B domain-containing protein, partial [Rhodococcus sp. (in: high G+C Gram-positive bacteria)]
ATRVQSTELGVARDEHDARRSEARAVHRRRDARDRGVAARERLTALAGSERARALEAAELDGARRAEPVRQRFEAWERERRHLERAVQMLRRVEREVSGTEAASLLGRLSWPPAPTDADTLDAAVHRWSGECAVLDSVAVDEAHRTAAHAQRKSVLARVESSTTQLQTVRRRQETLPAERAAVDDDYRVGVAARASLDGLEAHHAVAEAAAAARVECARLSERLDKAVAEADRRRAVSDRLRADSLDVRERRLDGMAAELAAKLVDGEPCVVCGAPEHPAPADPGPSRVSKADEDHARQRADAADKERSAADAEVQRLRHRVDDASARSGNRSDAELAADLDSATASVAAARASASRLAHTEAARSALEEEMASLQAKESLLSSDLSAAAEQIDSLDRQISGATDRIVAAVGASGSVATRRTTLDAAIAATVALRDSRLAAASATTAAAKLGAEVDAVVLDNGFADVADALGALRDSSRMAELEKSLLDAEREQSAHSAVLLEPEVVDAMSGVVVDVGPVDRAEELARLRVEEAVAAASDAERRSRTLRTLVTELWAAADLLGPLHAEHRELDRLATVVAGRGENDRKMSLRSYVLAARLEDVAIAASVRFRAMSGGRYEFVHSDDAGPRGTRGGLGLEVRDDYTGVVRAAGTLSGGESFCASLSLALGLADVVAAESGGVTLDTMFIDEGFGTLDAASLDAVMGVLDELRSGGRTVGIVSHVDEIRDRVPSRLEVIRDRRGSSVRVHAAV